MNTEMKIMLVDLDGTLADYEGQLHRDLQLLRPPSRAGWNEPAFDVHGPKPDWAKARIDLIKRQAGWWLNLPEIKRNFKIVDAARKMGFRIHVLTQGPRRTASAWTEKLLWCQKHLGTDVDVTITRDKSLFYGRVLFDDYPPYMDAWLRHRPRGVGIMPDTAYNRGYSHLNVVRFDGTNVREVTKALRKAFNRREGVSAGGGVH